MAALIRGAGGAGPAMEDGCLHGGAARIRVIEMYLLLLRAMYCTVHAVVHCLKGPLLFHFHAGAWALGDAVVLCVEGPARLVAVFGLVGRRRASNALLVTTPWFENFPFFREGSIFFPEFVL